MDASLCPALGREAVRSDPPGHPCRCCPCTDLKPTHAQLASWGLSRILIVLGGSCQCDHAVHVCVVCSSADLLAASFAGSIGLACTLVSGKSASGLSTSKVDECLLDGLAACSRKAVISQSWLAGSVVNVTVQNRYNTYGFSGTKVRKLLMLQARILHGTRHWVPLTACLSLQPSAHAHKHTQQLNRSAAVPHPEQRVLGRREEHLPGRRVPCGGPAVAAGWHHVLCILWARLGHAEKICRLLISVLEQAWLGTGE